MNNDKKFINELWKKAENTLYALYGDMPDIRILNRFYSEKMTFGGSDAIILWDRVGKIRCEALKRNHFIRTSGNAGSCFTAYLLGAAENNPLPLHYRCEKCGRTEFADKSYALPFDACEKECHCTGIMRPDGFDIPYEMNLVNLRSPRISLVVSSGFLSEAERMTSEYPSISVVPYSAFDKAEELSEKTGVDFHEVCVGISEKISSDERITRELTKGNTAGIANFDLQIEGFASVNDALNLAKPETTHEILKLVSALHGTGTWINNAERLVKEGVGIKDIPTSRDDLFMLLRDSLQSAGYSDNGIAFELTERIRHGRLDASSRLILSSLDLPEWFMDYVESIKYMFPKAHSVSYLREALAFMWFKLNYPEKFDAVAKN